MVCKNSHKIIKNSRLMCRICQLCLSQLWSDELSMVHSGREGCVGKVICEEGEGVVPQGGVVDSFHDSWREGVQIQEKQVPSSGIGPPWTLLAQTELRLRANTESCPPTHTHTHPGPCWLRENSDSAILSISPLGT